MSRTSAPASTGPPVWATAPLCSSLALATASSGRSTSRGRADWAAASLTTDNSPKASSTAISETMSSSPAA